MLLPLNCFSILKNNLVFNFYLLKKYLLHFTFYVKMGNRMLQDSRTYIVFLSNENNNNEKSNRSG